MLSNNKIILPISYFGNILYYKTLIQNKCEIEIHENFYKQTIRNRCEILGANKILKLTVPCKKNTKKTLIKDIQISYSEDWRKIHLKSIKYSYRSSPYFEYYEHIINKLFDFKKKFLVDFNHEIYYKILQCLEINYKIKYTLKYNIYNKKEDLRDFNFFKKFNFQKYNQVFDKSLFYSNLCILDLIFNLGPDAKKYLEKK